MDMFLSTLAVGIGATIVMDIWSVIRKVCLGVPFFNYGFIGRWAVLLTRGRLVHENIATVPKIPQEQLIGWVIHYLTGIFFAAFHLLIWGNQWLITPTALAAIITGLVTVVFPLCLIMPCMGQGFAASKTPSPGKVRLQSLLTHFMFGLGIWISAIIQNALI